MDIYPGSPSLSGSPSPDSSASVVQLGDRADPDEYISVETQKQLEAKNKIKYRTCCWKKAGALLFGEYVGIAIMSFGWSFSVLGIIPGLMLTIGISVVVMYVSFVIWEFCQRHPEVQSVCDVTSVLWKGNKWIWWFTAIMYVCENTVVQALHCLVGVNFLNSVTRNGACSILFAGAIVAIGWIGSFPRTLDGLSKLATVVTASTLISVMLMIILPVVQGRPAGWPKQGEALEVLLFPKSGTSMTLVMTAALNIFYAFLTQMAVPSIVAEMKEPRDFPKALWVATVCQTILFATCGSVVYVYVGGNYITSPSIASLDRIFGIVTYCFMFPTIIYMGIFHCSLSARLILTEAFKGTRHMADNTVLGWASWVGIIGILWISAFLLYEIVPFFSELMSLITSLFEPYFGFVLWAMAYFQMRRGDHGKGFWKQSWRSLIGAVVNFTMIPFGAFLFVFGTYISVQSIIDQYRVSAVNGIFSCGSMLRNA